MKKYLVLALALAFSTSCSDGTGTSTETAGVKVTATVANLASASISALAPVTKTSAAITPSSYKLALVNFWLLKDDLTEVNIINTDEDNPVYTTDRPLIVDFSTAGESIEILDARSIEAGTYTGYKMQFVYIEMALPAAFHIPYSSWETDFTGDDLTAVLDTQLTRNFRLYFNVDGEYHKRDFVVELVPESGEWYWMRSSVEEGNGEENFFISAADNIHLPGGAGPQRTIDLFADDFWQEATTTDSNGDGNKLDEANPIIYVTTEDTTGGMNVFLDESFTIPETIDEFYHIDVEVDISNTMNYGEDTAPPDGVTFFENVLDLGPGYVPDPANPLQYGDQGLHPFVPRLTVTTASSATDPAADATPAYQVPEGCEELSALEPAACHNAFCADNPDDPFCDGYSAIHGE